jgi:hypothetical protein
MKGEEMKIEEPKQLGQMFTVEEPPAPAPKAKRPGRENNSDKAVLFCEANAEQWCKVFAYRFTDAQTLYSVQQNVRQRKATMKRIAEGYGLSIQFTWYTDNELSTVCLYAKVSEPAPTERESTTPDPDDYNAPDD